MEILGLLSSVGDAIPPALDDQDREIGPSLWIL